MLAKNENGQAITPAVHLEFIQNHAGLAEDSSLEEVENYHRALFLHHHAREMESFQQQVRIHQDRLAHIEARLEQARSRLSGVDKLIPVSVDGEPDVKPTSPWNFWDIAMFIGAAAGIALLLVFGVLNISFNLLESGLVTFVESPVRAYFWAALLPVGAFAVKIGWDCVRNQRRREVYLWTCLTVGVLGVLLWLAAYSAVYPTLSKSTAEQIESLSVFDDTTGKADSIFGLNAAGTKWLDMITVSAQAIAEIFLSAVLGMYMTIIYTRHRPVRLAGNPLFTQLDQERHALEESVAKERLALAEAAGNKTRLENQLAALIAYAKSIYQKETAQRRDQVHQKNLLLEKISEQLRTQLESVENTRTAANHSPLIARNGQ